MVIGRFKIKDYSKFTNRGVPGSYFRNMINCEPYVEELTMVDSNGNISLSISTENQIKVFHEIRSGNWFEYLYGFSGVPNASMAKSACLHLFSSFINEPIRPYWHFVNGSGYDLLRDNSGFREGLEGISFLVIDGLTDLSTPKKLEKAYDLLEMYSFIPRAFIVSGRDCLDFNKNFLKLNVNRVLHFSDQRMEEI